MAKTRSWEAEELRVRLEREHGPAALQVVMDFEERLDAKYTGSAVTIQWRGSSLRKDEFATLWPWIEYGGVFYYPRFASGWTGGSKSLSGAWEE